MNERIKELAEQADQYARSDNSAMLFENFQKRYTEKFAELIVQECLGIVSDVGSRKWMGFKGTPSDECLFRIRQHFGVPR